MKCEGNVPELRERLMMLVMGRSRAGRHDLRSLVGMISRGQVASEEERIAVWTSRRLVGGNESRLGGGVWWNDVRW